MTDNELQEYLNLDEKTFKSFDSKKQKEIINSLSELKEEYNQLQYGLKIQMNSMFGAFCNKHFLTFNEDIGQSITRQGQDIIQFAERTLEHYFKVVFPKRTELHKKIGCHYPKPITKAPVIYCDTDSNFLCLDEFFTLNFPSITNIKERQEIFITIYKEDLDAFIRKSFEKYAELFNTKNIQLFELEGIFKNGIMLGKKRYVLNQVWKMPNIEYEQDKKYKITGVEIVRKNVPDIIGKELQTIVYSLLKTGRKSNLKNIIDEVKKFRKLYMLMEPQEISFNTSVHNYNQYVLTDKKDLTVASGCPVHIGGAGYYNLLLNKNQKLKGIYEPINESTKILWYYVDEKKMLELGKNNFFHSFAFIKDKYPIEFAPPIDKVKMFETTFLSPLNKFIKIMFNIQITNSSLVNRILF